MSNKTYNPGTQNAPFGLKNTNPEGSNYASESIYSAQEIQSQLQKSVHKILFDAAPAKYMSLKLLYAKSREEVGSDEFEYLEYTFGRSPLEVDAGVALAAQPAVVGANQTATVDLTLASMDHVSIDMILTFPDNSKAVITQIIGPNQIVIGSYSNEGLPAINAGDIISFHGTIEGDGMDSFSNYTRTETVVRYNYIQFFLRSKRWDRVELVKWQNQGVTDFLAVDKKQKLKQLRVDFFNAYWNGHRGEVALANGVVAKSMGGIFPSMVSAGSASATVTPSGLKVAFETLLFNTDHTTEGSTRFLYGTNKMLHMFSEIYKQPGLRYSPNNHIADLKLTSILIGQEEIVLVPCELWREESCFPRIWQRRLILLDQETITPVKMRGIPSLEMFQTDNRSKGSRENFTDWSCGGHLSLKFNNPLGSFYLDVL